MGVGVVVGGYRFEPGMRVVYRSGDVCGTPSRDGRTGTIREMGHVQPYTRQRRGCQCTRYARVMWDPDDRGRRGGSTPHLCNLIPESEVPKFEFPQNELGQIKDTLRFLDSSTTTHPICSGPYCPICTLVLEAKTMFVVKTVETKAGHVGQVINSRNNRIVWESSPETDDAGEGAETGTTKAARAAEDKINTVFEALFNGS